MVAAAQADAAEPDGAEDTGDRFSKLSRQGLLALVREQFESGVRLHSWGKEDVRVLARRALPRQMQGIVEGP